jgi:hypothetical protein
LDTRAIKASFPYTQGGGACASASGGGEYVRAISTINNKSHVLRKKYREKLLCQYYYPYM